MRRLARALGPLLLLVAVAGCGDDSDTDVGAGDVPGATEPAPAGDGEPAATYEGTIGEVTELEPITEGCTPPEDLDPDGSVSSDDPPTCTDPATAPLGSILVLEDAGGQVVFTIGPDTALARDGARIDFDELAAGQRVAIGFDGQIAESFPGQARADSVDVVG